MAKRRKRKVSLGSTATVHERAFLKAATDALSLANSALHNVREGDCREAFGYIRRMDEARGRVMAHNESGTTKRTHETAERASAAHAQIQRAVQEFRIHCTFQHK